MIYDDMKVSVYTIGWLIIDDLRIRNWERWTDIRLLNLPELARGQWRA